MKKTFLTMFFVSMMLLAFTQTIIIEKGKEHEYEKGYQDSLTRISMGLTYSIPIYFSELPDSECFLDYPKLNEFLGCQVLLKSKQDDFLLFLQFPRSAVARDSLNANILFGRNDDLNLSHLADKNYFYREFKKNHSNHSKLKYRKDLAKDFNADTVIVYETRLDARNTYKNKYKYMAGIIIQKKDRGFVRAHFLFTEDSYKHREKYYNLLSKAIVYS